jgi:hypothetical protein
MTTIYETAVQMAYDANDQFDKAIALNVEVKTAQSLDLERQAIWVVSALQEAVIKKQTRIQTACKTFRYYNDQAEFLFDKTATEPMTAPLGRELTDWIAERPLAPGHATRGYGSKTLDCLG